MLKKAFTKISESGLIGVVGFAIVALIYTIVRNVKKSPSMPSLESMVISATKILSSKDFYGSILYTMKIVCIGVAISLTFGIFVAVVCSFSKTAHKIIMPVVNCTKNIPSIALFPLFIVLMGIGDFPRIFVIIWNSIYPIISSTIAGLNSTDRSIEEAAQNCGANKVQLYFYIKFPMASLHILNGLKISLASGFIAIVVAEMLGATNGIGYMILWSSNAFKYSDMYVYILVISFIGFLINVIIEKISKLVERKMYL